MTNPADETPVVNIRPGVGILSVLRHLNYQPWFALAEYVDNSLQSYLRHRELLRKDEGESYKLCVEILVDPNDGTILVRDNAAGIRSSEFTRAFRPAEIPPDRSGLNEFGMGMKSASCWFAPRWTVRTSAIGEPIERTVRFDVATIIKDSLNELKVTSIPAKPEVHFTEIRLFNPFHVPYGRTVAKIKEHLADIYRFYLRTGELTLLFNDDALQYQDPQILVAPRYNDLTGASVPWRKDIDFDLGGGQRVRGFAALRETASTRRAGFALFRRGRLIQGSGDEGYRPHIIFGNPNSYRYQRLFGELSLEGFSVSHTKDGFQWDESEEPFLNLLREELDSEPFPLLRQAENWRASTREVRSGAQEATERTAASLERELPGALEQLGTSPSNDPPADLPATDYVVRRLVSIQFQGVPWEIMVELTNNSAITDWLEISTGIFGDSASNVPDFRRIGIRLSLAHPFMVRYAGTSAEQIEPLLRVAAGLAVAEYAAYAAGVRYASTVRRNLNTLLRDALSKNLGDVK
jgi:hypothetical protein